MGRGCHDLGNEIGCRPADARHCPAPAADVDCAGSRSPVVQKSGVGSLPLSNGSPTAWAMAAGIWSTSLSGARSAKATPCSKLPVACCSAATASARPCLAHAARPENRHQTHCRVGDPCGELGALCGSSDQWRRRKRQPGRTQCHAVSVADGSGLLAVALAGLVGGRLGIAIACRRQQRLPIGCRGPARQRSARRSPACPVVCRG